MEFMFFLLDRDYVPGDAPLSIHRISRVNELNDAFREERRGVSGDAKLASRVKGRCRGC